MDLLAVKERVENYRQPKQLKSLTEGLPALRNPVAEFLLNQNHLLPTTNQSSAASLQNLNDIAANAAAENLTTNGNRRQNQHPPSLIPDKNTQQPS